MVIYCGNSECKKIVFYSDSVSLMHRVSGAQKVLVITFIK